MQKLIFVRRIVGEKNGRPYDFSEVSNGISSFTLTNGVGVGRKLEDMELVEGNEFQAEIEVSTAFGGLRGTIVDAS